MLGVLGSSNALLAPGGIYPYLGGQRGLPIRGWGRGYLPDTHEPTAYRRVTSDTVARDFGISWLVPLTRRLDISVECECVHRCPEGIEAHTAARTSVAELFAATGSNQDACQPEESIIGRKFKLRWACTTRVAGRRALCGMRRQRAPECSWGQSPRGRSTTQPGSSAAGK